VAHEGLACEDTSVGLRMRCQARCRGHWPDYGRQSGQGQGHTCVGLEVSHTSALNDIQSVLVLP
jgi:hypothetical protein